MSLKTKMKNIENFAKGNIPKNAILLGSPIYGDLAILKVAQEGNKKIKALAYSVIATKYLSYISTGLVLFN